MLSQATVSTGFCPLLLAVACALTLPFARAGRFPSLLWGTCPTPVSPLGPTGSAVPLFSFTVAPFPCPGPDL
ncbi:hypothetical protein CSW31_05550, partial [Thermus scotoductus]